MIPAEVMCPGECYSVMLVYEADGTTGQHIFTWATDTLGCEGIELSPINWPWVYASLEGCVGSGDDALTYNFSAVIEGAEQILVSNNEVNGTYVNLDTDDLSLIIGEVCQNGECRSYDYAMETERRRLHIELEQAEGY